MVVLTIVVTLAITYTRSNTRHAARSAVTLNERHYGDAGLNAGYAVLAKQFQSGANAAAANILGCAGATGPSDTNGPSNCASPTPKVLCLNGNGGCTAGSRDSVSVYGYYSGTSAQTFLGRTVPASTWLIVSTAYAWNPSTASVTARTSLALVPVVVSPGAVAAVWNHLFLTAPLVSGVCQTNYSGNNLVIDVPLYVIGNLCLSGSNDIIKEVGQPVDLQVGGKLVLNGPNTQVGTDSTHPITSGVVVGGCTTVSVTSATTACAPASYRYYVGQSETFNSVAAPVENATDINNDYATFDPGPMHPCKAGTSPAGLAASTFDTDTTYNASAATFNLTPSFSYDCQSQSGTSVGRLKWDNTTKVLTISGSIFIDGAMQLTQSATYTGTAVIETAGAVTFVGNNTTLCATSPCNTALNAWQGNSGNNSMLTIATLKSNATSFTLQDNNQTFQGSLWTQPSASVSIPGNNATIEGPMSVGTMNNANNVNLKPLPVITNMPVGAPLPPNTGAQPGAMQTLY